MVINKGGRIQTDIFYKPTDSKQYILYTSCHPKHTRNNIPYNLARRLKTIVSENAVLFQRLGELKTYLEKRKYPLKLIEDAIEKVKLLDRTCLLKKPEKSKESHIIPYVTTFNPEIFCEIRQHKRNLHRNDDLHKIFKGKIFLKSKRQTPNLKRLLTKAKFTSKQPEEFKVKNAMNPGAVSVNI